MQFMACGHFPQYVCPCSHPPRLTCVPCFLKHQRECADTPHAAFPEDLHCLIADKQNFTQMQERLTHAIAIKQGLKKSLRALEAAEQTIDSAVEEVTTCVKQWEQKLRSTFSQTQTQVMKLLVEIERQIDTSICAKSTEQLSGIEHLNVERLLDLISVRRKPFLLKNLLASFVEVQTVIPQELTRKGDCDPTERLYLSMISTTHVSLFPIPELVSQTFSISNAVVTVDNNSCWCFLDCDHLFVCGGKSHEKKAALISISNRFNTKLPDMAEGRFLHCMVHFSGEVFVFGGAGKADKSAEKFTKNSGNWTALPSPLHRRTGASAALHENCIYIFGGARSDTIEQYSIDSSNFQELKGKLPYKSWSLVLPTEREMFVFTKDECVMFDPCNTNFITHIATVPTGNWWSPTPAVFYQEVLYFLAGEAVHRFVPAARTYLGPRG